MNNLTPEHQLKDGEPCSHPGCLHHVTYPCEGCGRIAGRSKQQDLTPEQILKIARLNGHEDACITSGGLVITSREGSVFEITTEVIEGLCEKYKINLVYWDDEGLWEATLLNSSLDQSRSMAAILCVLQIEE